MTNCFTLLCAVTAIAGSSILFVQLWRQLCPDCPKTARLYKSNTWWTLRQLAITAAALAGSYFLSRQLFAYTELLLAFYLAIAWVKRQKFIDNYDCPRFWLSPNGVLALAVVGACAFILMCQGPIDIARNYQKQQLRRLCPTIEWTTRALFARLDSNHNGAIERCELQKSDNFVPDERKVVDTLYQRFDLFARSSSLLQCGEKKIEVPAIGHDDLPQLRERAEQYVNE